MTQPNPSDGQAPDKPHPGTVVMRFRWNNSVEIRSASDFSDDFIFFCFDSSGKPVRRSQAAYCVPVVEIDTVSVDKNGKGVAPKDAWLIESTTYGPGHVFLEHTSSAPGLSENREPPRPSALPGGATGPRGNDTTRGPRGTSDENPGWNREADSRRARAVSKAEGVGRFRVSWCQRVKRFFSS
jgi:hypothetical protein